MVLDHFLFLVFNQYFQARRRAHTQARSSSIKKFSTLVNFLRQTFNYIITVGFSAGYTRNILICVRESCERMRISWNIPSENKIRRKGSRIEIYSPPIHWHKHRRTPPMQANTKYVFHSVEARSYFTVCEFGSMSEKVVRQEGATRFMQISINPGNYRLFNVQLTGWSTHKYN